MVDGIYNQSYRLPHFLVETVDTPLPIPVYFMRSVGSTAAVFFWESFISELAQRAGIDQYAYRRHLLADDALALRVLDAAAQAAGWRSPAPAGTFRGIAYNCYVGRGGRFKTYIAQVVDLARAGGRFAVKRVFCAVDPGLAVNPNTLEAQIQGGIGFALTNTLKSAITFSNAASTRTTSSTIRCCASTRCRRSSRSCWRVIARRKASARWCWRRSLLRWRRRCCMRPAGASM